MGVVTVILLSELRAGSSAVVKHIDGGRSFVQRLAEMGIRTGTELRAVRGRGPMIIEIKGHRLVIGHGMIDKIEVELL